MQPSDRLLLTIPQAAEALGVSFQTLYRLIKDEAIVAIKPRGAQMWIYRAELERYCADATEQARQAQRQEVARIWGLSSLGQIGSRRRGTANVSRNRKASRG